MTASVTGEVVAGEERLPDVRQDDPPTIDRLGLALDLDQLGLGQVAQRPVDRGLPKAPCLSESRDRNGGSGLWPLSLQYSACSW